MAILAEVPGLRVVVATVGDDIDDILKEYTDQDEEPILIERAKKTVYIESRVGRRFSIYCIFDTDIFPYSKGAVEWQIQFDGRTVAEEISTAAERRKGTLSVDYSSVCEHVHGDVYERPFVFAELPISEEADACDIYRDTSRLGTITVNFMRCHKTQWRRIPKRERQDDVGYEPIAEVTERQLKGRSVCHQIELGAAEKAKYALKTCMVSYPHGREPFATFEFRYRDIRTLQFLGLTPEKSATPAGGDVSNMEDLDYSSEDVSHEGTDEDGIDETDEDERDESDQDEPDEVEGTRDLGDVVSAAAAIVKRESRTDSIHSNAEHLERHINQEQSEEAPQADSTSTTSTVNVKIENTSVVRSPSIEPPIEQLSREELEAIARKYRARSPTVQRAVKRERPDFDDFDGAATRRPMRFKAAFDAEIGADVIDLDSD